MTVAMSMTSSAQSHNPLFTSLSGGYFFDAEAPYAILDVGMEVSDDKLLSLQLLHSQTDGDEFGISLDEKYTGLGLNYKQSRQLGGNIELYYTVGAGIAFVDVEARSGAISIQENTTTPYITTTVGIQERFSRNFTGHFGIRALWLDDFSVNKTIGGVTYSLSGPEHDINFGLELGFTYTF